MRPAILKYLGTLVASTMLLMLVVVLPATATDLAIGYLSSSCDGDSASISWQITTDRDGDAASHPLVRVEWRPESGGTWQTLGEGALSAGNSYVYADAVSGIDLAGATRIDVRATAVPLGKGGANWGDGRTAGDSYTSTLPVDPCAGDEDPTQYARVNWTAGCRSSSKQPAVMLFNDATPGTDATITYDILATMDGVTFTDTVDVEPGFSAQVPLEFVSGGDVLSPEDRTIALAVSIGDRTEFKRTFTVDCVDVAPPTAPTASTSHECGSRGGLIIVELTNSTLTASTFAITIDGEVVRTIDLTDETETLRFPVEDGTHDVVVTADGVELANDSYDVDCVPDEPEPSVELGKECTPEEVGALTVSATNDGADPVEFVVTIDGEVVDTFTVAAGTDEREYEVGDGTHTISVAADGVEIGSDSFDVECETSAPLAPSASVLGACDESVANGGVLTFELNNPTDEDVTFELTATPTIGDTVTDTVTVPAGTDRSYDLAVAPEIYDVTVVVDEDTIHDTIVDVTGCTDVQGATIETVCDEATGETTVIVTNAQGGDGAFVLVLGGVEYDLGVIAAGDTGSRTLLLEDGSYAFELFRDGDLVDEGTLRVTCGGTDVPAAPTASILGECDTTTNNGDGLITVELDNPTDETVTYVITATDDIAGEFTETLPVAANDSDSITLPVSAGIYDVVVTVDGDEIATELLDLTDCTTVQAFSIEVECVTGGVARAKGSFQYAVAGEYVLSIGGASEDLGTVAANETFSFSVPVTDGTQPYTLSRDGVEVESGTLPIPSCVSPTGLARTGLATHLLVPAALAMLMLGFGLVAFARRRGEI